MTSPKAPAREPSGVGDGPVFWHLDDIGWTEVQRQRNADGSVSVVREKWPIIRPEFLSAHVHYEPGMVVRRHGHRSNHVVFVLGGSGWIGGEPCAPGTHIHVPLGAAFGPIVAGPDGLTCWELSFGEFGGWGDQPELYAEEIAARGITPLPDPPLDIGDWFVDPRGDWGGERPSPKIDGLQSVLLHLDELEWVPQVGPEGGPTTTFRTKPAVDEPGFTSTLLDAGPGASLHITGGHRLLWIVEGGAHVGGRWCPAGTHIELPKASNLGELVAGDEGVLLLDVADLG